VGKAIYYLKNHKFKVISKRLIPTYSSFQLIKKKMRILNQQNFYSCKIF